jgi:hypothetical protein
MRAIACWRGAVAASLVMGAAVAGAQTGGAMPAVPPNLAPAVRANTPVFQSGHWFVLRSVREQGSVVACTGFYRGHRGVQLSKDMLIIKSPVALKSVALGFDAAPMRPARPMQSVEEQMGAVVIAGDDFAQLKKSTRLRIDAVTDQGTGSHELDLQGLAETVKNIESGCPLPGEPLRRQRMRREQGG